MVIGSSGGEKAGDDAALEILVGSAEESVFLVKSGGFVGEVLEARNREAVAAEEVVVKLPFEDEARLIEAVFSRLGVVGGGGGGAGGGGLHFHRSPAGSELTGMGVVRKRDIKGVREGIQCEKNTVDVHLRN